MRISTYLREKWFETENDRLYGQGMIRTWRFTGQRTDSLAKGEKVELGESGIFY